MASEGTKENSRQHDLRDNYFCDGVVGRGGQLRLEPRRDVGEELSHGVLLAVVGGDVEGGQS